MDDEKFRTEVLARLDRIVALLSASCAMSKAALERMPPPEAPRERTADADPGEDRGQYLLRDEMQDDYVMAIRRWKSGRGNAGEPGQGAGSPP